MSNAALTQPGKIAHAPAASQAGNSARAGDVAHQSETPVDLDSLDPAVAAFEMLGGVEPAPGQAEPPEGDDGTEGADEAGDGDEGGKDPESTEAESSDDDEGEEGKGEDDGVDAEGESDEETPEGEEGKGKVPAGVQKRIDELTAKNKGTEGVLASERLVNEQLQQQVVQLTAARQDAFGLSLAENPEALQKHSAQLEADAEKWEKVLDQGHEMIDGQQVELEPDRVRLIGSYVRDVRKTLAHSVPARQQFFHERAQWDAVAVKKFPWLGDPKDARTEYVRKILGHFPAMGPKFFAQSHYMASVVAEYELAEIEADGKTGAKGGHKAPGKGAKPVQKRPAAARQPQQESPAVIESDKDAEDWVASQLT